MDIRNCKHCGALFQYNGSSICPKCSKALEKKLVEVKDYLDEHKGATVQQVSEETGVSVKQLHRWVKEERLMFAPGVDTGVVCQNCGTPIASGRLCDRCRERLKNEFEGAGRSAAPSQQTGIDNKARMHLSRYK